MLTTLQLVTLLYLHCYTILRTIYTAEQSLNVIYFTFKFHDTYNRKSNFCASSPYPIISIVDCVLNIRPMKCVVLLCLTYLAMVYFASYSLFCLVFLLLLPLMANKVVCFADWSLRNSNEKSS